MSIKGTFYIKVDGMALSRAAAVNIKHILDQKVRLIDTDAELSEQQFAGLFYIFEWKGIPLHLEKAQMLLGFLKRFLKDYFRSRSIEIKIHLEESEG